LARAAGRRGRRRIPGRIIHDGHAVTARATIAAIAEPGSDVAEPLLCWRCGESLAELTLPLSRRDECPKCRAELHVCRMCVHYAPRRSEEHTSELQSRENLVRRLLLEKKK